MLTPDEQRRYQRQTVLPEIGTQGQEKLKNARVLVVGAGGLGCPVLLYLAAAGVGTLGIVDGDAVSESNLHRQILYGTADVGYSKAAVATRRLGELNPFVRAVPYAHHLDRTNALDIGRQYDLVVDCTDNFAARYLVNDTCVLLDKPFVYAAIHRFEGHVSVFNYTDRRQTIATPGPTYRCLFPEPPGPGQIPNCEQAGVVGVLPGIVGIYQANEVIKLITGAGRGLSGELLILDLLAMTTRKIRFRRRAEAGEITALIDYEAFCHGFRADQVKAIDGRALHQKLAAGEAVVLVDVREPYEYDICHLEGAILIPMDRVGERPDRIPVDRPVVVYCHHGMRSAHVIRELQQKGYTNLLNLSGGIDAWARAVDRAMAVY
ncbi:MAG: ThiF family adenylyltransferase [Ferruginibacter sp.]|nr:ThiF family adenylyltransferase [Cytophagales bacterium]